MNNETQTLGLLKHVPVRIAGSWDEKRVTTDPPRYVPHTEYALSWKVECDEELLLALMLLDAGHGQYGRGWRSTGKRESTVRLSFFPMDWQHSDAVRVNFKGLSTSIVDANFKHDPRAFVTAQFLDGEHVIARGAIWTLACIHAGRQIECRMFAVAKADTVAKRGRWALKASLAMGLPAEMGFLLSVATAGTF